MKYLITIIDREDGKTIYTADTNAIIAAIHEDDGVRSIVNTDCNGAALIRTIVSARLVVDSVLEGEPKKLHKTVDRVYRKMTKQQRREAKAIQKMARKAKKQIEALAATEAKQ